VQGDDDETALAAPATGCRRTPRSCDHQPIGTEGAVGLEEAAHLNELEMWRDLVRRSTGTIVDADGLLLLAGGVTSLHVAMRTDPELDAREALSRIHAFFAGRGDTFTLVTEEQRDADLAELAASEGLEPGWREVGMAIEHRVDPPTGFDGEIRHVAEDGQVDEFGAVVASANDDPESERAQVVFSRPRSILAPHIGAFIGYVDGRPASTAMTLVSHGVAGVFWVATAEWARRRGLGDALTRTATNAGFDRGARAVWLGSSEMGAGLYRRIGFAEFGPRYQEYEAALA
jgi:ribosomal protein S18 acetylase RimI-like enzyme